MISQSAVFSGFFLIKGGCLYCLSGFRLTRWWSDKESQLQRNVPLSILLLFFQWLRPFCPMGRFFDHAPEEELRSLWDHACQWKGQHIANIWPMSPLSAWKRPHDSFVTRVVCLKINCVITLLTLLYFLLLDFLWMSGCSSLLPPTYFTKATPNGNPKSNDESCDVFFFC